MRQLRLVLGCALLAVFVLTLVTGNVQAQDKKYVAKLGDLLSPERLRRRGGPAPEAVWQTVEGQWSGREDNALRTWALLTFEMWAETFLDADGLEAAA